MAQSDSVKSLSMFSAIDQIKTVLEAIELAEDQGHGSMVDAYVGDIYAILKDAEDGISRCVGYVRYTEKEAELIDEEIDRLKSVKKALERRSERIKQLALAFMDMTGKKQLEGAYGRKFTKVETKSVVITALDQIPDSLKRVTTVIEPNKKAIADYILEHGQCMGATLAINTHVRAK